MLHVEQPRVSAFTRFVPHAYSRNHLVELTRAGRPFHTTLIAISNYGARLKAPALSMGLAMGDSVLFNLVIPEKGLEAGRIPCRVSWVQEDEVEVAFVKTIHFAVCDMQAVVDH